MHAGPATQTLASESDTRFGEKTPKVGARLRAMGRYRESPIARERAPTLSPYGCTTVSVAGVLRPTPRSSGRYMSSTNDGGTV
ncbi:hypothetical protein F6Y24_06485 [Xanthomonas arboricola pv. pruni]|uniref:Uncharacterized protein n=1 Tax=Xanthomonas arboricola pv. pruni str. MAFF 311562 TaxID=1414836 RepID=W4RYF2_9XANT|nr:hypothetical protein F6Y24_06485 [Xanthomonas arboricola pv. pruni]RST75766.1 hypothetical protein EJK96_00970 [Xanthomonas arboricola pv. pruni]RST80356.1 hypothetical protein EJL05_07640 [Xanthomonas arboricola pv. pruni]GAE49167.1 hypothetical protein XPU_0699 [Xanthomonas arboricola pv. pruni str. MAFF 311562]GAE59380.1 hypothetical protein XPN_1286 [Xanthomonas arboricola pv. pruni MAFF 301427]